MTTSPVQMLGVHKGRFYRAEDLKRRFRKQVSEFQRVELEKLFSFKNNKEIIKFKMKAEGGEPGQNPPLQPYIKKGFRIRYDYKGKRFIAKVKSNGKIRFRGKIYNSPSLAAAAATNKPQNGWICWKYHLSPGEWVFIDELRK